MLQIRAYQPQDRAAVRNVFMETAYLGNSIRPYYPDEDSMADALTAYYTDSEPESAWVVTSDERVVGYLLGCVDTRKAPAPEWVLGKHVLKRFLWARPGTAKFFWRAAWDALSDLSIPRPKVDYQTYPAHAHIDLLPEARKGGTALKLFRQWLKVAEQRGACGMWGLSFLESEPSTVFHRAMGFRAYGEPFGMRAPAGEKLRAQVWVRALKGQAG